MKKEEIRELLRYIKKKRIQPVNFNVKKGWKFARIGKYNFERIFVNNKFEHYYFELGVVHKFTKRITFRFYPKTQILTISENQNKDGIRIYCDDYFDVINTIDRINKIEKLPIEPIRLSEES
jgi:hypothetical protein